VNYGAATSGSAVANNYRHFAGILTKAFLQASRCLFRCVALPNLHDEYKPTLQMEASLSCQIHADIIPDHIATNKKRLLLNPDSNFITVDSVGPFDGSADSLYRKVAVGVIAAKTAIIRKDLAPDGRDQPAGGASKRNSK